MRLIAWRQPDDATCDYVRGMLRYFLLVLLIALIFGAAGPWSDDVGLLTFPIGVLVTAAVAILGTIYWLVRAVELRRQSDTSVSAWWVAMPFALLILSAPAALFLGGIGTLLGHLASLAVEHREYEAIIARAPSFRAEDTAILFKYPGQSGPLYVAEPGSPLRVIFNPKGGRWPAGSIVYDEAGDVMARPAPPEPPIRGDSPPDELDMVWRNCARLWRKYEVCWANP